MAFWSVISLSTSMGSTTYVEMEWIQNVVLSISYGGNSMITTAEQCKVPTDKTFHYATVKVTPRILLN